MSAPVGLMLSVTTRIAHGEPLAVHVVKLIGLMAPHADLEAVETALQEALANAVIHGNLELASIAEPTAAGLNRFAAELNDRLANQTLAQRLVTVQARIDGTVLRLEVTDQGQGYVPTGPHGGRPFGRGLALIEHCADRWELRDDGRSIRLEFDL